MLPKNEKQSIRSFGEIKFNCVVVCFFLSQHPVDDRNILKPSSKEIWKLQQHRAEQTSFHFPLIEYPVKRLIQSITKQKQNSHDDCHEQSHW